MFLPRLIRLCLATTLAASIVAPASAGTYGPMAPRGGMGMTASATGLSGEQSLDDSPREILVRFDERVANAPALKAGVHRRAIGSPGRPVGQDFSLERVVVPAGVSVEDAIETYEAQPGVQSAQPNRPLRLAALPGDPRFDKQWGMYNTGISAGVIDADVDATDAWDRETGSDDVIVAVIDTGIDYEHPDLADNMWVNTAEQNGVEGVDDDGNGYTDDVYGIDTLNHDSDPMDDHGHGTHCAGTIGAAGDNGVGGAGLARNVRIMAIKAFGWTDGDMATAIEAIQYAEAMGADIISCSWGGYGGENGDELYQAIQGSGALFSCAAGNDGASNEDGPGATVDGFTPAGYELPNIISVAASDRRDLIAPFSNYGATSVDLAAPGVSVFSTVPGRYNGSLLFFDEFGDLSRWTSTTNLTSDKKWALTRDEWTSSPFSVGVNGYANNQYSALELNQSLVLAGDEVAILGFNISYDTQAGKDFIRVMGSKDGSTWQEISAYSGKNLGTSIELDLAEFMVGATAPLRLRFVFESDASGYMPTGGAHIDDVYVYRAASATKLYDSAYDTWDGTSMAAPFVSGTAALLKAHDPLLSAAGMRSLMIDTVDTKTAFTGKLASGGRLNANRALARIDGDVPGRVTRVAGYDRYAVAEQLANRMYPGWAGVDHVLVAAGDPGKEADPLSAAGLAGVYDAPVLLTQGARLPSTTRRALTQAAEACAARGTTLKVHIVGGPATVPDARWKEIAAIPGVSQVKDRLSGADRYAVTATIAERMVSVAGADAIEGALVMNAENPAAFYDALAVSPIAAARTMPMLAVRKDVVPSSVYRTLNVSLAGKPRYLANGTGYVSQTVATQLNATRLATSSDQYAAAAQIARAAIAHGWLSEKDTALASKLPDALTGGVFAGSRGGVMLFTGSSASLVAACDSFVTENAMAVDDGWIFGGTASVPASQEAAFRSRIH